MKENQTLKNKIVILGKIGFLMTAVTILFGLFSQAAYQYCLWSANWFSNHWLWNHWSGGFTVEELSLSPARELASGVSLLDYLFNLAITFVILLLFRAMWKGRAISRQTAGMTMILGILSILWMVDISIEPIPLELRSEDRVGIVIVTIAEPFGAIAYGILAFAISSIIRFADLQKRQLDEIV